MTARRAPKAQEAADEEHVREPLMAGVEESAATEPGEAVEASEAFEEPDIAPDMTPGSLRLQPKPHVSEAHLDTEPAKSSDQPTGSKWNWQRRGAFRMAGQGCGSRGLARQAGRPLSSSTPLADGGPSAMLAASSLLSGILVRLPFPSFPSLPRQRYSPPGDGLGCTRHMRSWVSDVQLRAGEQRERGMAKKSGRARSRLW